MIIVFCKYPLTELSKGLRSRNFLFSVGLHEQCKGFSRRIFLPLSNMNTVGGRHESFLRHQFKTFASLKSQAICRYRYLDQFTAPRPDVETRRGRGGRNWSGFLITGTPLAQEHSLSKHSTHEILTLQQIQRTEQSPVKRELSR